MKLTTKIAIASNVGVIAVMIYAGYDYNQDMKRAEDVAIQVQIAMEKSKQVECLATNIYHEARSDGLTGQRAVAWSTLNRTKHKQYPDNICDVVYQAELNENGIPLRNKCQFSWFCDGKSDDIEDQASWNVAQTIAEEVMNAYGKETDPTNGAIMYHADYVKPYWASSYERQARIDSHIFYN